jgi:phosphatidylserine/phosphatidylglycerophosphate/cardiolipin synthase-like enzyme
MKLSDLTIETIYQFFSGDNELTPELSGRLILKLFNHVGFRDVYRNGMPDKVSRNDYVKDKLYEINGNKTLRDLIEIIFDYRHFSQDSSKDIHLAVKEFNLLIKSDGYKLEEINDIYKIIGENLPDEISVEIHFEKIQGQIIERIKSAKFIIWVAVAWLTDKELLGELWKKQKEGVNVRLIINDDEINKKYGIDYEKHFDSKRVEPIGRYENIMHNKFCVIDLKTVIHGSYNWSVKAQWNKETISIDDSKEIAEKFATQFMTMWK